MTVLLKRRVDSLPGTALCARCVPESNGVPQEFRRAMVGQEPTPTSLPLSVLVAFHFLGTLPAHRPAYEIAKVAIGRPLLADAGSAIRMFNGKIWAGPRPNRSHFHITDCVRPVLELGRSFLGYNHPR
jgi:hypothetical protein